jgi:hypothetical protein
VLIGCTYLKERSWTYLQSYTDIISKNSASIPVNDDGSKHYVVTLMARGGDRAVLR